MQNETGPKKTCPLDITGLSRNDFTRYLTDEYDEDNPDKYNNKRAQESLAVHEAAALHDAQMKQLASTTVNAMTITGGTTNTASSSGGGSSGVTSVELLSILPRIKRHLKRQESPIARLTLFSSMTITI